MNERLSLILREYGLDENEITLFLILVGSKELTGYELAKEAKMNRSTCYDALERLIKKGFASRLDKYGKNFYSANDLNIVLANLKNKENIITTLKEEFKFIEDRQDTNIKFLEDTHSQKEFNLKILDLFKKNKITFLYIISNGPSPKETNNIFTDNVIKEAVNIKNKIKGNFKFLTSSKLKDWDSLKLYEKLGENRFLDNLPTVATTIIFDNYLAFLYSTDTPKVIEIKNKNVGEEMKAYFELMWKSAKK